MNYFEIFPGDPAAPHLVFVTRDRSEQMINRLFTMAAGAPFSVVPVNAPEDVLAELIGSALTVVCAWGKRANAAAFLDLCAVFGKELHCVTDGEGYAPANPLYTGTGPMVGIGPWGQS